MATKVLRARANASPSLDEGDGMLEFLDHDGDPVFVAPTHICAARPHSCNRDEDGIERVDLVLTNSHHIVVRASLAEVRASLAGQPL